MDAPRVVMQKLSARTGILLGFAAVLVLVSVFVWLSQRERTLPIETPTPGVKVVRVMYTSQGFVPAEIKIESGTTVTFLQGTQDASMWVASNDHPEHSLYSGVAKESHCPDTSGIAFDQCSEGVSYSFTFRKLGEWEYHNHLNPDAVGKVIVTK